MKPESLSKIVNNPLKAAVRAGIIQQILLALPEISDKVPDRNHIPVLTLPGEAWLLERQLQMAVDMMPSVTGKLAFYGVEKDYESALRTVIKCPDNGIVVHDTLQNVLKYHIVNSTCGLWETSRVKRTGSLFAPIMWLDHENTLSAEELTYFANVLQNVRAGIVYYTLTIGGRNVPSFDELKRRFAPHFNVRNTYDTRSLISRIIENQQASNNVRKVLDIAYTGGNATNMTMLVLGYKVGLPDTNIPVHTATLQAPLSSFVPEVKRAAKLAHQGLQRCRAA